MRRKRTFAAVAVVCVFAASIAGCKKFEEEDHTNSHLADYVSPSNNPATGPEEDTRIEWNAFREFLDIHTYMEQQLDPELKTTRTFDSIVIAGLVPETIVGGMPFAAISVCQKNRYSDPIIQDIAIIDGGLRRIEVGPERHDACGIYMQHNTTVPITVHGKNFQKFTWNNAPVQIQKGWPGTSNYNDRRKELDSLTAIAIYL